MSKALLVSLLLCSSLYGGQTRRELSLREQIVGSDFVERIQPIAEQLIPQPVPLNIYILRLAQRAAEVVAVRRALQELRHRPQQMGLHVALCKAFFERLSS